MDVVPAGSGWKTDPYKPEIIDGKLYARGSSDDGPTMACYYGLKIIKTRDSLFLSACALLSVRMKNQAGGRHGLLFQNTSDFLSQILASHQMRNSQSSMGKKGNITEYLHFEMTTQEVPIFIALQVAFIEIWYQSQRLQWFLDNLPDLAGLLDAFAKEHQLQYEISTVDEETYTVDDCWEICSRINPEDGINGATYLALSC